MTVSAGYVSKRSGRGGTLLLSAFFVLTRDQRFWQKCVLEGNQQMPEFCGKADTARAVSPQRGELTYGQNKKGHVALFPQGKSRANGSLAQVETPITKIVLELFHELRPGKS
jgi:hypothetical protein